MQNYSTNGVYLLAGSIAIFGTSFESGHGYEQILNGGCDINASSAGVYDPIVVYGSRTESLCFYKGAFSQLADISGANQAIGSVAPWSAKTAFSLNTLTKQLASDGHHVYRVTTAGTSGSTAPTWPSSGTVTDGTVVWTLLLFNAVSIAEGHFDRATSFLDTAASVVPGTLPSASSCGGTTSAKIGSTRYKGSIVEGIGGTGCKILLNFLNYVPVPTCVVSSQTGTAFTYKTDGFNLDITNSNLTSSATFDWICHQ